MKLIKVKILKVSKCQSVKEKKDLMPLFTFLYTYYKLANT